MSDTGTNGRVPSPEYGLASPARAVGFVIRVLPKGIATFASPAPVELSEPPHTGVASSFGGLASWLGGGGAGGIGCGSVTWATRRTTRGFGGSGGGGFGGSGGGGFTSGGGRRSSTDSSIGVSA